MTGSSPPDTLRRRVWYVALALLTMLAGLASRRPELELPGFLVTYAGDTLWALLVFWLLGLVFVGKTTNWVAAVALGFCFLIETSQLYQTPWLNSLRATLPGSLVLGHGFLWRDLLCYTVGVALGWLLETGWQR
ncbi:DUF2809 domain-containing protein [Hymenobacter norwichensis]|uniref:ribosomal maturation YjgA family protein n=1 Tax=Hymenobacter norwichensis TaxID=223903 RepID=UPI0003B37F79|nr:DUF2809 domain-containing protein [Hymenobacter norwichensis]